MANNKNEDNSSQRLDKILSHHGFGTRKDVKKLLRTGNVLVNGVVCVLPEKHIVPSKDVVCVDGTEIALRSHIYLMMNKCAQTVCSAKDGLHKTVFDLLNKDFHHASSGGELHLVGRLDIDTEGLLILTTDGDLTHKLTSPKTHVPKTYIAGLRDSIDDQKKAEYIRKFTDGIHIDAEGNEESCDCQSAVLSFLNESELSQIGILSKIGEKSKNSEHAIHFQSIEKSKIFAKLTIYEGKYHQVKRMFAAVENEVVYLKRISVGSLELDYSLDLGDYRELSEEELALLVK